MQGVRQSTQLFIYSRRHEIRAAAGDFDMCVDRANSRNVHMWGCHSGGGNQFWTFDDATGAVKDDNGVYCLHVEKLPFLGKSPFTLTTKTCDGSAAQLWEFVKDES